MRTPFWQLPALFLTSASIWASVMARCFAIPFSRRSVNSSATFGITVVWQKKIFIRAHGVAAAGSAVRVRLVPRGVHAGRDQAFGTRRYLICRPGGEQEPALVEHSLPDRVLRLALHPPPHHPVYVTIALLRRRSVS